MSHPFATSFSSSPFAAAPSESVINEEVMNNVPPTEDVVQKQRRPRKASRRLTEDENQHILLNYKEKNPGTLVDEINFKAKNTDPSIIDITKTQVMSIVNTARKHIQKSIAAAKESNDEAKVSFLESKLEENFPKRAFRGIKEKGEKAKPLSSLVDQLFKLS
jgi:hypothetical protein